MATTCKAKVDIGPGWKKGTVRVVEDGRATLLRNSDWVEVIDPEKEKAPPLATGGVVSEPQLVTIGDGDEEEVVNPLTAPTDTDPEENEEG